MNPRLVIIKIPKYITTENLEDALIAQNPGLKLFKGDKANFSFENKKKFSEPSGGGRSPDQKEAAARESKIGVANL